MIASQYIKKKKK